MRKLGVLLVSFVVGPVLVVSSSRPAAAHGARVESSLTRRVQVELEVEVLATYHSGRPMAGAGVRVMAPGESETPWRVGTCDDEGRFVFQPPADMVGTWEVRVLQHGHGGTVRFDIDPPPAAGDLAASEQPSVVRVEASSSPHLSALQLVVMAGCVVWGLVGTALFFFRRRA